MKQTRPISKLVLAAIFELVIAIDLLFPTWLGADLYFARGSTTLWRIGRFLNNIRENIDAGFGLTLAVILIYALLVLSLLAVAVTGRSIIRAFKKDAPVQSVGFFVPAVLSVLVILVVIIGNLIVSAKSEGYMDKLFYLERAPIVILILAVASILLLKKVPDAVFSSIDQKLQGVSTSVGSTVSEVGKNTATAIHNSKMKAKTRICPSCGAVCAGDSAFCAACGTKLPQAPKCAACGKELTLDAKFCPYCGQPVHPAENTSPAAEETVSSESKHV